MALSACDVLHVKVLLLIGPFSKATFGCPSKQGDGIFRFLVPLFIYNVWNCPSSYEDPEFHVSIVSQHIKTYTGM